jgi:hypothetical protein
MASKIPAQGGRALKRNELEAKTVAELRAIARAAGLSLGSRRKAAIIEEIIRGFRKKSLRAASSAKRKGAPSKKTSKAPARPRSKMKAAVTKKTAAKKAKPEKPVKAKAARKKPPAPPVRPRPRKTSRRAGVRAPSSSSAKAGRVPPPPLKPVIAEEEPARGPGHHVAPLTFVEAPQPPQRNMATAIAVEPTRIFAYWELREATARKGEPAVRVHDVTGRKTGGRPRSTFDIRPEKRAGGLYVRVLPGREYVVEAGVFTARGRFIAARKSRRVKTPPVSASGEKALIPEEYFRFAPVSYWPG